MENRRYEVKFRTKDKYNPTERSIIVETRDGWSAVLLVADQFDSIKLNERGTPEPSERKIEFISVLEVDEDGNPIGDDIPPVEEVEVEVVGVDRTKTGEVIEVEDEQ